MNILVLEPNQKDRVQIQQALSHGNHRVSLIETSEQAWPAIQRGETRFIIADWDESDVRPLQFIPRLRSTKLHGHVYVLLLTAKGAESDLASAGADDVLRKPLIQQELMTHIALGERMASMASTLADARNQLDSLAMYDSLTSLLNRTAFYRQAQGELERARRLATSFSLIALDIDGFKSMNESYGIETGDNMLRIVSQVIREKSRPYDCVGRWTGDEFVIALVGVIGADAEKVSDRILTGVRSVRITDNKENLINVKLSGGIASVLHISAATELEPIIQQARQAMGRAKEAGGNQAHLTYL